MKVDSSFAIKHVERAEQTVITIAANLCPSKIIMRIQTPIGDWTLEKR